MQNTEMQRLFAVVPAAGHSRRMGRPKLLLPLGASTVIARMLAALARPEIEATIRNARLLEAFATLPNLPGKLPLFGTTIQTGSVTLIASKATIRDKAKFWRRFASAKEGDVVPIAIAAETIRGFLGPSEHEGLFIRPDPSEQDVKSE